jgi:hypothetical protein
MLTEPLASNGFPLCSLLRERVLGEPLANNGLPFWLHYSGFQASCHNIEDVSNRVLGRPILIKREFQILLPDIHPPSFNSFTDINDFLRYTCRPVLRT